MRGGSRVAHVRGDAGDATPTTSWRATVERFGGIDIWVNNAARLMVKPILETTDEDWHGLLAANLHGYFYGCRAAARQMVAAGAGGRIVNVSSAADILAVADLGAYIAAKGAIVGADEDARGRARARTAITVNALAPGATDTPLNTTAYTPEVRRTYEERIPLGRIGARGGRRRRRLPRVRRVALRHRPGARRRRRADDQRQRSAMRAT